MRPHGCQRRQRRRRRPQVVKASRQSLLYLRYLTACHFASSQASTQDPVWIAVDPAVKPWFLRRGRVTAQTAGTRT